MIPANQKSNQKSVLINSFVIMRSLHNFGIIDDRTGFRPAAIEMTFLAIDVTTVSAHNIARRRIEWRRTIRGNRIAADT